MLRNKNFFKIILLITLFAILLFVTLEVSLRILGRHRKLATTWFLNRSEIKLLSPDRDTELEVVNRDLVKQKNVKYVGLVLNDEKTLYRLRKSQSAPQVYKVNGDYLFNITISTDGSGLRTTFDPHSRVKKKSFVTFWGGSRTFGWGVSDEETLPSHFQNINPEIKVYNYAVPGHSPQFFLKSLELKELTEIQEKKGIFYYVFDADFDYRTVGSSLGPWVLRSTYYEFDSNNQLVEFPDFKSAHPGYDFLYKAVARSAVLQNLNIHLPFWLSQKDCQIIATIFSKSQDLIKQKNAAAELKVVFFYTTKNTNSLIKCLSDKKVSTLILDESAVPEISDSNNYFAADKHPRGFLLKKLAEKLSENKQIAPHK